MADLGRQLRQARQSSGISIEALSARTKITKRALEAIERGEFEKLPGGVFTRAFIRSYAREVGVDPDQAVADYRAESDPVSQSPSPAELAVETTASKLPSKKTRTNWSGWTLAAVVLIGLLSVLVVRGIRGAHSVQSGVVATTGTTAADPRDPETPTTGPAASQVPPAAVEASVETLTLEIAPAGVVWLDIRADGQRAFYGLLQPGERRTVEAHQDIVARVGDAGAFQYSINGQRGRSLGASQQIRDIRITRDNLREFTSPQ